MLLTKLRTKDFTFGQSKKKQIEAWRDSTLATYGYAHPPLLTSINICHLTVRDCKDGGRRSSAQRAPSRFAGALLAAVPAPVTHLALLTAISRNATYSAHFTGVLTARPAEPAPVADGVLAVEGALVHVVLGEHCLEELCW